MLGAMQGGLALPFEECFDVHSHLDDCVARICRTYEQMQRTCWPDHESDIEPGWTWHIAGSRLSSTIFWSIRSCT
jgi:hypothetical protein